MTFRIGSLCTGYGGLDLAVHEVLGGELSWVADNDPGAAAILAHRFPMALNLADITTADWAAVEPVDVLTAGFPCQDISYAGRGEGIQEGNRSGLWYTIADALGVLRPGLVVLENVAGLVGRRPGLDVVLGDLARLGFDAEWTCLRAADVGAPHGRKRIFITAWPVADTESGRAHAAQQRGRLCGAEPSGPNPAEDADGAASGERGVAAPGQAAPGRARANAGGSGGARNSDFQSLAAGVGSKGLEIGEVEHHGPQREAAQRGGGAQTGRRPCAAKRGHGTPADTNGDGLPWGQERDSEPYGGQADHGGRRVDPLRRVLDWGIYGPAIARWEQVFGHPAPRPTEPGRTGERLSPRFVEWMLGLPKGWVTDTPGLSRNAQLKALGNGVVPQQAVVALKLLLPAMEAEAAA